ncbi:MAG: hypothetical protein MI861_12990, partial [Pirellulales bacterium]|nr:hypothetical protein [Pirellulales bacterium]
SAKAKEVALREVRFIASLGDRLTHFMSRFSISKLFVKPYRTMILGPDIKLHQFQPALLSPAFSCIHELPSNSSASAGIRHADLPDKGDWNFDRLPTLVLALNDPGRPTDFPIVED